MSWTCPYCKHNQINNSNRYEEITYFSLGGIEFEKYINEEKVFYPGINVYCTRCLNISCNKITLELEICKLSRKQNGNFAINEVIKKHSLLPECITKNLPSYIPLVIKEDYYEACKILNLSPKASATLARRCLQGMIRDFCGVTKSTLNKEIEYLKDNVFSDNSLRHISPDIIEAIDCIRKVGNIGAHMEKDINLIIEIEPSEAYELIKLLEVLFDEWYINRHNRELSIKKVSEIAQRKEQERSDLSKFVQGVDQEVTNET